ncbi:DNA mismatch repair protein MutS [Mailhella sp.]|uniref:DNA mismatch repair protein MutS n=1 Tax=Mailhella sp. TaxID=1981029 RepID=UPI004062DBB3
MSQMKPKLTPMYRQYMEIKQEYPDTLLFYRMGDFYELFFDDAEVAARELQLTLTSRSRDEGGVPMCGVPWHAAEAYISQLVEKGFKIAVCDQIEDPKQAKGLVKRAVTRVVTSGTALEDSNLEAKAHTYLGALFWNSENSAGGFAWLDVSTGAWTGLQSSKEEELKQWALKMAPRELLVPDKGDVPLSLGMIPEMQAVRVPFRSHFELKQAEARVLASQNVQEAAALGLEKSPELMQACGALVAYLQQTQKQDPTQLAPFKPLEKGKYLILDEVTERNLELFRRLDGKRGLGTLWAVMDHTRTPMGGRLLEERMRCPWRQLDPITLTQDVVALFHADGGRRKALRAALDSVYDMERLSTRISLSRCQPHDFSALKESLASLPAVLEALSEARAALESGQLSTAEQRDGAELPTALQRLVKRWDMMDDVADLLTRALRDSLPPQVTDGGLFRQGYSEELDELLDLVEHGENRLQELLREEQERNDMPKLKLGFNHVFGYYFELTRAQQTKPIPEHFQRRQSLANSDRFTTPKLKELEEKLLTASEKRKSLEYRLYQELRERISAERPRLVFMADILAHLDYWQSLAEAAERNGWTRPVLHDGEGLSIRQGRHPVVEAVVGRASFIPNDLVMDEKRHLVLITGPNMAGKSTVLRQTAIIAIMAQMGSFVPATEAVLGLSDRIFSRVGASDNLAQGQSTFMVEMMETARILRQAGRRSLVILDEIGRGTSTFDGLALAWAVVEELSRRAGGSIRTLFATHYHELTALANTLPGVCNMNIAIREWNGDIVFLRRLIPGPADKSYGIEVARLAGVPSSVVSRAREILGQLESARGKAKVAQLEAAVLPGLSVVPAKKPKPAPLPEVQPAAEHPIFEALRGVDPNAMTPMDALRLLSDWKALWGTKKD